MMDYDFKRMWREVLLIVVGIALGAVVVIGGAYLLAWLVLSGIG